MLQWSPSILDTLVAPGISGFSTAEIPDPLDQFPEAEHWLGNHFLNAALGPRFRDGFRQIAVAFMRRAQQAFKGYREARQLTFRYLEGFQPGNPGIRRYYAAVDAWEGFTLQSAMAMDLFRWLNDGTGAFAKNDGSKEFRLYTVANLIKHTANSIESGQCRPEHTLPLWLSSQGLESFDVSVSFAEVSEVLVDICRVADDLQNPRQFAKPK